MDSDRELLERTNALAQENNKLLKKMRRSALWGTFFRILFWLIIFGVPVALYYYVLQPYFVGFWEAYQQIQDTAQGVQEATREIPEKFKPFLRFLGLSVE